MPAAGRGRPEALAPEDVVHSASGWHLCRPDGGCARSLCRRGRSQASGGLLRRKSDAVDRGVREPIPAAPGQPERYDCEYRRNGPANLFVFLDAHTSWRHVKVTDHRTARDFADCMREVADVHYPDADRIRVVMDNLSTHTAGALYEAFPAPEAHRVLQRLEFHYTPKHASWLNMVEIEIGVLRGQCLDRRIGERDLLESEIAEWQRQRNASGARVKWKFTTQKARTKMARAYPNPSLKES